MPLNELDDLYSCIAKYDDNSKVELDYYTVGGSAVGAWGELGLIHTAADNTKTRWKYVRVETDSPKVVNTNMDKVKVGQIWIHKASKMEVKVAEVWERKDNNNWYVTGFNNKDETIISLNNFVVKFYPKKGYAEKLADGSTVSIGTYSNEKDANGAWKTVSLMHTAIDGTVSFWDYTADNINSGNQLYEVLNEVRQYKDLLANMDKCLYNRHGFDPVYVSYMAMKSSVDQIVNKYKGV